jgi:hypothetical protein
MALELKGKVNTFTDKDKGTSREYYSFFVSATIDGVPQEIKLVPYDKSELVKNVLARNLKLPPLKA